MICRICTEQINNRLASPLLAKFPKDKQDTLSKWCENCLREELDSHPFYLDESVDIDDYKRYCR